MYIFTLGPANKHVSTEAKLDVKAAFANLSALWFPVMPTCKGIHAMIISICGGNFSRL